MYFFYSKSQCINYVEGLIRDDKHITQSDNTPAFIKQLQNLFLSFYQLGSMNQSADLYSKRNNYSKQSLIMNSLTLVKMPSEMHTPSSIWNPIEDDQTVGYVKIDNNRKFSNQLQVQIFAQFLYPEKKMFHLFRWLTVRELKEKIIQGFKADGISATNLRLFYKNIQMMDNDKSISDYHLRKNSTIVVQLNKFNNQKFPIQNPKCQNLLKTFQNSDFDQQPNQIFKGILNPYLIFQQVPLDVVQMINTVKQCLNQNCQPKLATQGLSGTYFIQRPITHQLVALFKPYDEQPYTPNNPKLHQGKLGGDGFRKGILSGQSATRQVATYILSAIGARLGYSHDVPTTTYVEFYHPIFTHQQSIQDFQTPKLHPIPSMKQVSSIQKLIQIPQKSKFRTKHGSLQRFMRSDGNIQNFGSGKFSIEEVHKIAILDIRILNCDRNSENILVKKIIQDNHQVYKMIPIDHGLSFPDNFQLFQDHCIWMSFPQARKPFTQAQLEFIKSINPQQDAFELHSKLGFRDICIRNFRIAETFLKKAAQAGLTLYQMGKIIYRQQIWSDDQEDQLDSKKTQRSQLQEIVLQAQELYHLMKAKNKINMFAEDEDEIKQNQNAQISEQNESNTSQKNSSSQNSLQENDQGILQPKKYFPQFNHQTIPMSELRKISIQRHVNNINQSTSENNSQNKNVYKQKESSLFQSFAKDQVNEEELEIPSFRNRKVSLDVTNTNSIILQQILHQALTSSNNQKQNSSKNQEKISKNIQKKSNRSSKFYLKRNVSLPHLKKKTTQDHEKVNRQRRRRQGLNGVHRINHSIFQKQSWDENFYHYFEQLLDTFLIDKHK